MLAAHDVGVYVSGIPPSGIRPGEITQARRVQKRCLPQHRLGLSPVSTGDPGHDIFGWLPPEYVR